MAEESIIIRAVPARGPLYQASRVVRGKVLREPLGLGPEVEVFPMEHESVHILALDGPEVVGCVLFHRQGEGGRLYQMAVLPEYRSRGIGARLVETLEQLARSWGVNKIYLHGRDYAVGYYESLGYEKVGDPFIEVTIEHFRMEKTLTGKDVGC